MGKYDPLQRYLSRKRDKEIELSFADIERIICAMLPNSAQSAQWWANDVCPHGRNVQSSAWLNAGYDATLLASERVRFTRRMVKGAGGGNPNTGWIVPERPGDEEITESKGSLKTW